MRVMHGVPYIVAPLPIVIIKEEFLVTVVISR